MASYEDAKKILTKCRMGVYLRHFKMLKVIQS
jgi:hypothetical protein